MNNEQMEKITCHFGVVAEALRSDIRQVAEGHALIRHELKEHRGEIRDEFKEMRAIMRLSFPQLDQRIHTLEMDISALKPAEPNSRQYHSVTSLHTPRRDQSEK